jgi:hypothetical protein
MSIAATPAVFGRSITSDDMKAKASAFWHGYQDGDAVNLYEVKKAVTDRFIKAREIDPSLPVMGPVLDAYDPAMIQKALFDDSFGTEGFSEFLKKARSDLVDSVNEALENLPIKKAFSTDSSLMHTITDKDVTFLFRRVYPLQGLIDVEANLGKIAQWDAIPPNGAGSAYFGPEDPTLVESDMTDYTRTATVKIMYAPGRVTKLAQFAGAAQVPARDMMSIRMLGSMEMVKNLRERRTLGVTSDVTIADTAYSAAGAFEYKGLYELITANTGTPNYVTAGGSVNTWSEIEPLIDESYRRMVQDGLDPNVAICDSKTFNVIRQGMNVFFHSENMKETNWGIKKIVLNMPNGDIPLITDFFMPTTTGATGSMFLLDTAYLKRRVLWPEMYQELAQVNTSKKYVIDAAEVIIDKTDVNGSSSLQGGVFGITLT